MFHHNRQPVQPDQRQHAGPEHATKGRQLHAVQQANQFLAGKHGTDGAQQEPPRIGPVDGEVKPDGGQQQRQEQATHEDARAQHQPRIPPNLRSRRA